METKYYHRDMRDVELEREELIDAITTIVKKGPVLLENPYPANFYFGETIDGDEYGASKTTEPTKQQIMGREEIYMLTYDSESNNVFPSILISHLELYKIQLLKTYTICHLDHLTLSDLYALLKQKRYYEIEEREKMIDVITNFVKSGSITFEKPYKCFYYEECSRTEDRQNTSVMLSDNIYKLTYDAASGSIIPSALFETTNIRNIELMEGYTIEQLDNATLAVLYTLLLRKQFTKN